jgi:putative oxidoreductase
MNSLHKPGLQIAQWLDRHKEIGILLLRVFVGVRLIYGVADNVLSWEHMLLFENFLRQQGFPFPLLSAILSVYAQLIGGLLLITGFYIRLASVVLSINFMVALLMVHRHDTFEAMTPALAMLVGCLVCLFYGSGKYSL